MTSYANSGNIQQTLLMLLMFGVSLLQMFLTIEDIIEYRFPRFLMNGFLLAIELSYCGILFAAGRGAGGAELFEMPVIFLWISEAVLLVYTSASYIGIFGKAKRSLSRESIKEGIDNLPDGVCFFDEHGAVRLINRKMLSVGIMLFGSEIQTLDELHAALLNPPAFVERLDEAVLLYRFPDGTVRRFTERAITDRGGNAVTEVIAADITELYTNQAELNRENARLAEANQGMKRLLDNMGEIVREKEILSMKMRVHDDIGHSILAAKKALLQQQDIAVIRENAAQWERAVDVLYRANNLAQIPDEWEAVKARARDLEVEIELDGELPEHELMRHLLFLAVRECVTNCVRHAGGSKVFVALTSNEKEITCVITNNGKAPEHEITEGGGLSGLRRRIEREGGRMKLQSAPHFALSVIFSLKEMGL